MADATNYSYLFLLRKTYRMFGRMKTLEPFFPLLDWPTIAHLTLVGMLHNSIMKILTINTFSYCLELFGVMSIKLDDRIKVGEKLFQFQVFVLLILFWAEARLVCILRVLHHDLLNHGNHR